MNMKDDIVNSWLRAKSFFRFFINSKPKDSIVTGMESYVLDFEAVFTGNTIDAKVWHIGQKWGPFHPDYLHQYYGDTTDFVNVKEGFLELLTRYKPKKFYNFKDSIYVTIPYGIGLVVSNRSFKYGYYEIEASLPEGKYLWPAIWLTAVKTWPPEIDILESYSGFDGAYSNKCLIRNLRNEPNIHYGFKNDNTKSNFGGTSYPIPDNPTDRFVRYGLHWTKEFIRVYYDGHFVFQCTQTEILKYFNAEDVEMNIILNNALVSESIGTKQPPSVFKIKSVKFFSKK